MKDLNLSDVLSHVFGAPTLLGDGITAYGGTPSNDSRANAAAAALAAYTTVKDGGAYANESLETRVGDLLCDLMHLVARDGEEGEWIDGVRQSDPTILLARAQNNFEAEQDEEVARG